jgi:predicted nucleic acid-binding protein
VEVVILDSSALVALLHESDALHAKSVEVATSLTGRQINFILPSEVFAETINIMGKKFGNATAIRHGQALLDDKRYFIQASRDDILTKAMANLKNQKSSTSFIDCLVMEWADYYSTKVVFGFDAVFEASGYRLPAFKK